MKCTAIKREGQQLLDMNKHINVNFCYLFIVVPGGPPQRVAVTKINITSYRVTWKPVRNGLTNGIITKYEALLILTKIGTKIYNSKNAFQVSSKAVLQYVFHNLALCALYTVKVRAFTREGFGPYSRAVLILTQSKYDMPSHRDTKTMMIFIYSS